MTSRSRVSFIVTGIAASAAAFALAQEAAPMTGTSEPPLQLYAEHGGAEVAVTLDQPVTIGGATFTLRARANRLLGARDFEVQYPSNYHFEYQDDELHMWTLTGADASLMVFVTQQALEAEDFLAGHVDSMSGQFEGARVEATTLTLEGAEHAGKRVRMALGDSALTQEAYALPVSGGRVLMLLVQDSPGEQAESAEARALKALVAKTFRRKP